MKTFGKVMLWVLLIAIVVFVVFLLSIIISGNFNGFGELWEYLVNEFNESGGLTGGQPAPPPNPELSPSALGFSTGFLGFA